MGLYGKVTHLPDTHAADALGSKIAALLRVGDAIALSGDLGSGKTSLARAIIAALGFTGEVPSPSFAIIQQYDPPDIAMPVIHADFYRLESAAELAELGIDDIADYGVLIAEWPENVGGLPHQNCLAIGLTFAPKGGRDVIITLHGNWESRWPG